MTRGRVLAVGLILYLGAWALTATVGMRDARAASEMPRDSIESWKGTSIAPCVILVHQKNFSSAWSGCYLWFFGWGTMRNRRLESSWYPIF